MGPEIARDSNAPLAVVVQVHLFDIKCAEVLPLSNRGARFLHLDSCLPRPAGEVAFPIVHDGAIVVRNTQAVYGAVAILVEVVFVICINKEQNLKEV